MYDTAEYALNRLSGTIIRIKDSGVPIIVSMTDYDRNNIQLYYNYLANGLQGPPILLSDADLTPVSLGWANHTISDAAFLARVPKRSDWRQGLRMSNYTSLFGSDKRVIEPRSLCRTIEGFYMSFELSLDEAFNSGKITSFCRNFAVKPLERGTNLALYFKWYGIVGDVLNGTPQLYEQFDFLQESLGEVVT